MTAEEYQKPSGEAPGVCGYCGDQKGEAVYLSFAADPLVLCAGCPLNLAHMILEDLCQHYTAEGHGVAMP